MQAPSFSVKELDSVSGLGHPVACYGLALSEGREHLLSVGTYKPSVKLYSLKSMSMKFERHCAEEPTGVIALSNNAEKFVVLRRDRTLEFHTRNGLHEKIQTPFQLRGCAFSRPEAKLYLCGDASSLFCFDLEEGILSDQGVSFVNDTARDLAVSPAHGLICVVGSGFCRAIDPRSFEVAKSFNLSNHLQDLTKVAASENGINILLGTESGKIAEFDIRTDSAINETNVNGSVRQLSYRAKNRVVAADKSLHIFSESWTNTEIDVGFSVNTFAIDGSVIFIGGESDRIRSYNVGGIGATPFWCSDLAN